MTPAKLKYIFHATAQDMEEYRKEADEKEFADEELLYHVLSRFMLALADRAGKAR